MSFTKKRKKMLKKTCFILTLILSVLFYNLRCSECSSFYFWWDGGLDDSYGIYLVKTLFSLTLFSVFLKDHLARRIYTVFMFFLISNVVYWLYVFYNINMPKYLISSLMTVVLIVFIALYLVESRKTKGNEHIQK